MAYIPVIKHTPFEQSYLYSENTSHTPNKYASSLSHSKQNFCTPGTHYWWLGVDSAEWERYYISEQHRKSNTSRKKTKY